MTERDYLKQYNEASIVMIWTLDFWRAFNERPRLLQWIARLCVGRYAWRELVGARDALDKAGYDPSMPYDLHGASYHHEADGGLL